MIERTEVLDENRNLHEKRSDSILFSILILISIVCLFMIYVGANGLALAPRKAVFTYQQGETLKTDPGYYFKGVTEPDRVKMDLSKVDTKKPGIYTIQVKQSSRRYDFKIKITE